MSKFILGICQMTVGTDKKENLNKAEAMIREAVEKHRAQVVALPEMFNCPYENRAFPLFAEIDGEETTARLKGLAKELSICLVGGSIPEREGEKLYNTSFIFGPEGQLLGKHRKVHLFDVEVAGGISFKESDTLAPGNQITVVKTPFCKIGVAICYDMRFPELMRLMALKGAELIVIPAAFNLTTGPAHWHETIKMRAVDNQVYFAAVSPARNLATTYHAYGHSALIDPWGTPVAQADETETLLVAEVDLDRLDQVRNSLPLLKHRREDCYRLEAL